VERVGVRKEIEIERECERTGERIRAGGEEKK
jgi:hypothetical protein